MFEEMFTKNLLKFDFNGYFFLLEKSILDPYFYSGILKNSTLKEGFVSFGLNASFWLLISSLIKTFQIGKYHLFFAVLSENLILIPSFFIFLVCLALMLHVLARFLGSRSKFRNNLKGVLFSTTLLPFFAVPVFKIPACIISLYILIFCFKAVNRFDKIRAVISVFVPVGIFIFALYLTGIININLITR